MSLWQSDVELFKLAQTELFTAVVGDVMDKLGFQSQFLPPHIRPLQPGMVAIGRAMTTLEEDIDPEDDTPAKPFGLMLEALDDLRPHEIYISSGSSPSYALWGELMSVRAMHLGAAGAVLNGYSRDTNGILALGFPTFSYGPYAQDQAPRGRVVDFRTTLDVDGVTVRNGDVIFADIDGVCVIPQQAEEAIFVSALEKARGEKTVRKAIEQGMSTADAFAKFGIM